MDFQDKPQRIKLGVFGATILPLLYLVFVVRSRDPEVIASVLGPPGKALWAVQQRVLAIGGWILAVPVAIILLSFAGGVLGALIGVIVDGLQSWKTPGDGVE